MNTLRHKHAREAESPVSPKLETALHDFLAHSIDAKNMAFLRELAQYAKDTDRQQKDLIAHLRKEIETLKTGVASKTEKVTEHAMPSRASQYASDIPVRDNAYSKPHTSVFIDKKGRYFDQGDGSLIDRSTGLQWLRFCLGQRWDANKPVDDAQRYTFAAALDACGRFNQRLAWAGFSDWRLPTREELSGLIDTTQHSAIDQIAFPATPHADFWTASICHDHSGCVWCVDFANGNEYWHRDSSELYVRLVRQPD